MNDPRRNPNAPPNAVTARAASPAPASPPADVATPGTTAVVLLSGGLDSTTCLAWAKDRGYACVTLAIDYGQRHRVELAAARRVARAFGVTDHREVRVDLRAIGGSALTSDVDVPKDRAAADMGADVPITYVPARNSVFLSLALGLAETLGAHDLVAGMNALDYSGYPDCRPEFVHAFESLAALATRAGVEGARFRVHTPLMSLDKAAIVRLGVSLGVDYAITHSCYDPAADGAACGGCDACVLRRRGFEAAGVPDPTRYAAAASVSPPATAHAPATGKTSVPSSRAAAARASRG